MFKKSLLVVSVAAALSLVGCGGGSGGTAATTTTPTTPSDVNIQSGVSLVPATVSIVEPK